MVNKRTRNDEWLLLTTINPCRKERRKRDYGYLAKCTSATLLCIPEGLSHIASNVSDHCQGRGNQGNKARGRAFMLGSDEARQDPKIMMGLEPSELGFKYEIEIASEKLVKIDKVPLEYIRRRPEGEASFLWCKDGVRNKEEDCCG
ncbi:hypothetical protein Tco_1546286 [Tanacetum coccineum]